MTESEANKQLFEYEKGFKLGITIIESIKSILENAKNLEAPDYPLHFEEIELDSVKGQLEFVFAGVRIRLEMKTGEPSDVKEHIVPLGLIRWLIVDEDKEKVVLKNRIGAYDGTIPMLESDKWYEVVIEKKQDIHHFAMKPVIFINIFECIKKAKSAPFIYV